MHPRWGAFHVIEIHVISYSLSKIDKNTQRLHPFLPHALFGLSKSRPNNGHGVDVHSFHICIICVMSWPVKIQEFAMRCTSTTYTPSTCVVWPVKIQEITQGLHPQLHMHFLARQQFKRCHGVYTHYFHMLCVIWPVTKFKRSHGVYNHFFHKHLLPVVHSRLQMMYTAHATRA